MLEISWQTGVGVLRCSGHPSVLDAIDAGSWLLGRVAPDELLLVVPETDAPSALATLRDDLAATAGLAVDHTDAFRILALSGELQTVLARLTAIRAPTSGFFQGLIADVACKAFIAPRSLLLLAPSPHGEHVRQRVVAACRGLAVETPPAATMMPAMVAP